MMGVPLHGVVDFSGCGLLRGLYGILIRFLLRVQEDGAIFGVMVGRITIVQTIWRFDCVRASTVTAAPAH
jgi:hypothetical protein